jgi:hypothetical protein
MDPIVKSGDERATGSHDSRQTFQTIGYNVAVSVVLGFCIILLFGIAYPPPKPNMNLADWGAAIVARAAQAWPSLLAGLGALSGLIATTLARGAYDAKLEAKKDTPA